MPQIWVQILGCFLDADRSGKLLSFVMNHPCHFQWTESLRAQILRYTYKWNIHVHVITWLYKDGHSHTNQRCVLDILLAYHINFQLSVTLVVADSVGINPQQTAAGMFSRNLGTNRMRHFPCIKQWPRATPAATADVAEGGQGSVSGSMPYWQWNIDQAHRIPWRSGLPPDGVSSLRLGVCHLLHKSTHSPCPVHANPVHRTVRMMCNPEGLMVAADGRSLLTRELSYWFLKYPALAFS